MTPGESFVSGPIPESLSGVVALAAVAVAGEGEAAKIAADIRTCNGVLLGSGVSSALVAAFRSPRAALEASKRILQQHPGTSAALLLAEVELEAVARTLEIVGECEPGQLLVSLAMQDLLRESMPETDSFREFGNVVAASSGRREKMFLLQVHVPSAPAQALSGTLRVSPGFVGRSKELEHLHKSLAESRLVTVTGVAGVGKTALIQRFAAEVEDQFADGVLAIDLSPIQQPHLVLPALSRLIGVMRLPGESTLDSIAAHFRNSDTLLILDSCEQVLDEVRVLVG